jgi:hypothetical protein
MHHPGDLHAGDERRLEPQLVLAAQEQQIGKAHTRRTDVDDNRIVATHVGWIFYVCVYQPCRPGKLPRDKCFHVWPVSGG